MNLKTISKVGIARALSRLVLGVRRVFGKGHEAQVRRAGANWQLDLREGIELAIYLLGRFDRRTYRGYRKLIRPGDVVLDIGANIGAHTLQLAHCVGSAGRVYAFEATDYAYAKLCANLELNPELARRTTAQQTLLSAGGDDASRRARYSSWPLTAERGLHGLHGGRLNSVSGALLTSLDERLEQLRVERVDLMKIDVDGDECEVLLGARRAVARHRPVMVLELAPYILDERPGIFERLLEILGEHDYRLVRMRDRKPLPADAETLRKLIPYGSGINVFAVPESHPSRAVQ